MGRIEKFTKDNMKDILKVTKSAMVFVHQKPPQPSKALWGVFFLSFEFIIQIICNDTSQNWTNDNCYDEKCNSHLYITPPFTHRKCFFSITESDFNRFSVFE
ncbi:hypothetical protein E1N03_12375 [Staphylococcus epidermidis]|nr:hypothetical protein E1N03_12375 [Staphylococcus epidermidis]